MGLYLCSKSDSPDLNRAFTYWNSLQSIPITTESEKHQRELDLEHILAACLHSSEWSRCSSLLHSSFCSPRHVYLYLRSLASSSEFKRVVSGYLDYRSTLFSDTPTSFVQEKQFVVALLLDIAKITNDATLLEVVLSDVLHAASDSNTSASLALSSTLFARMARLGMQFGLVRSVYGLYVLNGAQFRDLRKVYRAMERFMSYADATDEETAEMKQKVRELHWGQTDVKEEEEKGMVFDEDEFIEEDVLQILKDGFNVKRKKEGKSATKIMKEKGQQRKKNSKSMGKR